MHAKVQEFSGQTELSSATFDRVVAHNVTIAPFAAGPPADSGDAARYWERHEGMFGAVARGGTVDSPVHTYASTSDTEFYVLAPDSPVSGRSDPYAVRAFRDAHPLDDQPGLFDNGNGYRILITDEGVKALAGGDVPLAAVRTFQTLAQPITGGVYYDFGKYSLSASAQPQLDTGVDPSQNDPPAAFDRTKAFSLANFNMENLYDFRNDPFDGCDFTGDPGCPGVSPPFDYPPASDAVYQARETSIAHQVIDDLHSPDVISVAEAEDQDICTVVDWTMSCGTTNNADGQPDTVQELAVHIHALGGPDYAAAYDRDGADARGIVSAFLYRSDRVSLANPTAGDAVLGSSPQVSYRGTPSSYNTQVSNPKSLNAALPADVDTSTGVDGTNVFTRAPQVGHFLIWKSAVGTGYAQDVWVLANHFTSGPDSNVGQRREQAAYNAAIVAAIQHQDPSAKVDVGGDLNVYPRPDDPFPPPNTSDQLAPLYNGGLHDLFDSVLATNPSAAYSYDYEGQAQDLDHQFVSPALFDDLLAVNEAHINSDWTPGGAFANRGTSDHDPMVSRWALNGPPAVSAGGPYTVGEGSSANLTATGTDPDGDPLTYRWDLNNDGVFETAGQTVPFDATAIDGPAERTVAVQVSDGKLSSTDTTVVHVTNVAPTAALSGAPSSSPEGTPVTATGSATDPAPADTLAYAWAVTKNGAAYASGTGTDIAFTPDDNGTYVISFTATDDDGGVNTASSTVDVTNVAPAVSVTAPSSSAEGSVVNASASATDPGTVDGTPAFAWSVTKDGSSFASGTGPAISYTPNDNGTYVVTVTATDKDGGVGTASATTQVTNVDPTATFNAPSSAVSGTTFTISLSNPADASSVDATSLSYAFDCGSGFGDYGSAQSRTCTAAYDGTQTVSGRVRDKDGGVSTYTATVHITVTVNSVCALVQSLAKNAGEANSLCVKLQHGQIDAFGHEVDAQAGKAFTADQAALLKRLAAQL